MLYLNLIQHNGGVEFDVCPQPSPAQLIGPSDTHIASYRVPFTLEGVSLLVERFVDLNDIPGSVAKLKQTLATFEVGMVHVQ